MSSPTVTSPHALRPTPEVVFLARWFTAARREGFLALLTPEVWHTLSAVLSFTSRRGGCTFTLDQLATALGASRDVAAERLQALPSTLWQGQPLATIDYDSSGALVGATLQPLDVLTRVGQVSEPAVDGDLHSRLRAVGLTVAQAEQLTREHPAAVIVQQLDWLSDREARNPAALLIRAIEERWTPPKREVI